MKSQPDQSYFDFVKSQSLPIHHLPYTEEFESFCSTVEASSLEEKHKLYERLLELAHGASTPTEKSHPTTPQKQSGQSATTHTIRAPSTARFTTAQPSLFDEDNVAAEQPWTTRSEPELTDEIDEKRIRLLAGIANGQFAKTEIRIAYILQRFPETRDSDTALCIRYWKLFQPDVLERWTPLELEVLFELHRIETIGRLRRVIQNEFRLFRGLEDTAKHRDLYQRELHEYLASHRDTLPEVRFYLDETGNEGDKTYTGVAGVCVINWKQYEKHYAALTKWRKDNCSAETIHFSETGTHRLEAAVSLLGQLEKRRSGMLFVGYALASRGRTNEDMFSLFIQLVVDSLGYIKNCNCLGNATSVQVIKEANVTFDNMLLEKMTKQLSDSIAMEFPGEFVVRPALAVPKGRDVLLECADLVAGGMQRRALRKGRNPKDRLAETVMNVTGFEDCGDTGTVFKFFPMR